MKSNVQAPTKLPSRPMTATANPAPTGQLRPLVERRPAVGRAAGSLGLGLDRGFERGVVERRIGLGGHR